MAITFHGVGTTPADNAAQAGPTVTVAPPASMVSGDLVVVFVKYRDSAATISDTPSNTGGQAWNLTTQYNTTNIRARVFWCRYNGTWSANPGFTVTSGTNNMDVQMLVFRPTSADYTWTLESGSNAATYSAPSTPFTVTVTGRTTTAASTVSIAAWHSVDDNTWGSLSGSGWSKTNLAAQYRNESTQDNSSSYAYNIRTSAGATNDVSQNQATLGGDAGSTSLWTFAETLVTAVIAGVAATAAAGSLGISHAHTGFVGVESVVSAGTATGTGGSPDPNATVTLAGVAASADAGSVQGNIGAAPAGVEAAASAGSVGVAVAIPVSGVGATAHAGDAAAQSAAIVAPDGVSATADAGVASVAAAGASDATATVSGVVATGDAGALAVSPANTLDGAQSTAHAGSLAASTASVPDGVSATASAGDASAVGASADAVLIAGVSATAHAGLLASTITTAGIESVVATASAGIVSAVGASADAVLIDGVSATAHAGAILPLPSAALVGVEATATAEELGAAASVPEIDGVEASALAGAVSAAVVDGASSQTATVSGALATATAGSVTIERTAVVLALGVSAAAQAGTLNASSSNALVVLLDGVESTATAGVATTVIDGAQTISVLGVSAVAAVGDVIAGDGSSVLGGGEQTGATGGWLFLNAYEAEQRRRRAREKARREREEETERIEDTLDRQIAELLREQEAKDEKREDYQRLAQLAKANADLDAARKYSERVAAAYARVLTQGNYSAIEALDRELKRAREEEEFIVLALMMLTD